MDKNRYANLRVFKEDASLLKIVSALSYESMLQTFKRLVLQEYERLQREGGERNTAMHKDQA